MNRGVGWVLKDTNEVLLKCKCVGKVNEARSSCMLVFFLNFYSYFVHIPPLYMSEWSSKSIETKAIFTKIEMNNEWNVHFFQNIPLGI